MLIEEVSSNWIHRSLVFWYLRTLKISTQLKQTSRDEQRKKLLDSVTKHLPEDLRPDLYLESSGVVEIMTWGQYPWEFAHFTDEELADALIALSPTSHPGGRNKLIASINAQRTKDPSPDIEDAWKKSGVKKLALAEKLWPLLESQIRDAISKGEQGPPVMQAVLRARHLGFLNYGVRMGLKRHTSQAV